MRELQYVIDYMTDVGIHVFKFNIKNFLGHIYKFFIFFVIYNIYINNLIQEICIDILIQKKYIDILNLYIKHILLNIVDKN